MALRFFDGFDHYNTSAQMLSKGWTSVGSVSFSTSFNSSVNGHWNTGQFIYCPNNGGSATFSITIDNQASWYVGIAFQSQLTKTSPLIQLFDGATLQCALERTALNNGQSFFCSVNGVSRTASSIVVPPIEWCYLELGAVIHPTTGSLIGRLNGQQFGSFTGNTRSSANSFANTVTFTVTATGGGVGADCIADDVYICDATGSVNNTFLGPARVAPLYPTADGTTLNFTPSTGTSHFSLVNEHPPNDDTNYVSSTTANDIDLYQLGTSGITGGIAGLQLLSWERKDDGAAHTMGQTMRLGGTNYDTSLTHTTTSSYSYGRSIVEINPATSLPFTATDLSSGQFGPKYKT